MTREDIGRVAIGAPALQQVVVVSLPDCLLVKQWARNDEVDADASAVHLGNLFRTAQDSLRGVALRGADLLTLESSDAVVMVVGLGKEAAAGFIFDRSAPLGLLRVQARQLAGHLESMVPSLDSRDLSQDLTMRGGPSAPESAPPRPTVVPAPLSSSAPSGAPNPVVPPFPPPPARPAPSSAPASAPAPAGIPPAASSPSPSTSGAEPRPRAVRLLDFFRRYAPDPHASMLRLSLRTGISLDLLGRPEGLTEAQVETVANAVRDILGQEQVGV